MKPAGATVAASPAASSSRRSQPMRQARTNPPRRSNLSTAAKSTPRNGVVSTTPQQPIINPKFYPALASFTDSIDALPAEIIRNFTLLREVDAKACHPEEQLRRYIAAVKTLPPPADPNEYDPALEFLRRQEELRRRREEALMNGENPPPETDIENSGETVEQYPETRRSRLQQIRMVLQDLLPMLDEKIHVITGTAETLHKHNLRVEQAYQYVQHEIPEIFRSGDPDHWGYKPNPPKGASARAAAERADRAQLAAIQAANQAAAEEARIEYAANSRAENRREALLRRQAAQSIGGHEEEDALQQANFSSKRPHGNTRVRKEVDSATHRVSELAVGSTGGTSSGQSAKRRKPNTSTSGDKGGQEKTSNVRGTTSPRAGTPTMVKRTTKGTVTTSTTTGGSSGRRRQTAAPQPSLPSLQNPGSPSLASSPVHTTFPPNTSSRSVNGKDQNGAGSAVNSPIIPSSAAFTTTKATSTPRQKKESGATSGPKDGTGKKDGGSDEGSDTRPANRHRVKTLTGVLELPSVKGTEAQETGSHDDKVSHDDSDTGLSRPGVPPLHPPEAPRKRSSMPGSPTKESQATPIEGVEPVASATGRKSGGDVEMLDSIPPPPPPPPGHKRSSSITAARDHHGSQQSPTTPTSATASSSKRKRGSIDQAREKDTHAHESKSHHQSHHAPMHTSSKRDTQSHSHRRTHSTNSAVEPATPTTTTTTTTTVIATTTVGTTSSFRHHPEGPQHLVSSTAQAEDVPEAEAAEDEDEEPDPDEPTYCFCNQISYGQMVGCDDKDCAREWFHLDCVGLTTPPKGKAKWYCSECLERRRQKGRA